MTDELLELVKRLDCYYYYGRHDAVGETMAKIRVELARIARNQPPESSI